MDLRLIDRHSHVVIFPTRDLTAQNIAGQMRAMIAAVSRQSVNNGQTEFECDQEAADLFAKQAQVNDQPYRANQPGEHFHGHFEGVPVRLLTPDHPAAPLRTDGRAELATIPTQQPAPSAPERPVEPGQGQSSTDSAPKSPLDLSAGD